MAVTPKQRLRKERLEQLAEKLEQLTPIFSDGEIRMLVTDLGFPTRYIDAIKRLEDIPIYALQCKKLLEQQCTSQPPSENS